MKKFDVDEIIKVMLKELNESVEAATKLGKEMGVVEDLDLSHLPDLDDSDKDII